MKTKNILITLLLIIPLLFQSCGIVSNINPEPKGEFSANIDGKTWKADDVSAVTIFGAFSMTASQGDDDTFLIGFLISEMEVGKKYPLDNFQSANVFSSIVYTTKDDGYLYKGGSITITRFDEDKIIEGNFDMIMEGVEGDIIEVKNGDFKTEIAL